MFYSACANAVIKLSLCLGAMQERIEGFLETALTRRRRQSFLSSAGPFLLVVTFIEDGMRIFLRWGEQIHYMTAVMHM